MLGLDITVGESNCGVASNSLINVTKITGTEHNYPFKVFLFNNAICYLNIY